MKCQLENCIKSSLALTTKFEGSTGNEFYHSFFYYFVGALNLYDPELAKEMRDTAEKMSSI